MHELGFGREVLAVGVAAVVGAPERRDQNVQDARLRLRLNGFDAMHSRKAAGKLNR